MYIISNIGAFGENMFKIGMTRRLDPMERIDELSSASVPFNFDVHALIFTEDAPGLEAALHRAFEKNKVNKINTRREFFRVSLSEIKAEVRKNFDKTVEWTDFPEADQYRQSLLLGGSSPELNTNTSNRIVPTQSTSPAATPSTIDRPTATPPAPQQSLPEQIRSTLKDYRLQEEDNPAFFRLHVYDTNNRKLGIVKITKPDMKITFKVPGNPNVTEISNPEEIKNLL